MSERFPKKEKLKSKMLFDRLFSKGKSVKAFPLKLVFVPIEKEEKYHKTGFSAPKRNFKNAVDRNKLKRLMREAFRKNKHLIKNTSKKYALLFIYLGKSVQTYDSIFSVTKKALQKLVEQEKQP